MHRLNRAVQAAAVAALLTVAAIPPAGASPTADPESWPLSGTALSAFRKSLNRPPAESVAETRARREAIEARDRLAREHSPEALGAVSRVRLPRAKTGTDRVLVILVEFDSSKTDSFTWTPGVSTWDPLGKCNPAEYDGVNAGNAAASTKLAQVNNITAAQTFNYSGPLHNQIERPQSAADRSGDMVWSPDFSAQWYRDLIFGDGVKFVYSRQDGSHVNEDFTGKSVRQYFEDASGGRYTITGDVLGWVKVPHSVWWYGADACPGARSGVRTASSGAIPGAGNAASFVRDAIDAAKAAYPAHNWRQYDQNGDGVVDRLWIIHAGLGEEDATTLLDRTTYGESALWSHSGGVAPYYQFWSDPLGAMSVGSYIMMPENSGISVLAHEFAHNLGADDLYAYGLGQTSAGFWTLMADNWTGHPIGFLPPAVDPWHLDNWGWLDPAVVTDPTVVTRVRLGQASSFPGAPGSVRGARIALPDQQIPLPVQPYNSYQWWSGAQDLTNGGMRTKSRITLPATDTPRLGITVAWDIEAEWDFLWVMVSEDGVNWKALTNAHTSSTHDPSWIGGQYGLPADLAAAGYGGFTGRSTSWPSWQDEFFDLSAWKGKSVYIRFWYMTDWGTLGEGAFLDDVRVESGTTVLFRENAAANSSVWQYEAPWERNRGARAFSHNYYLQWRNTSATGGYDAALGDPRYRYGPVNPGLVVWYNNNRYTDNEVGSHLTDWPGFGPKGRMLVVDAHPEPYRDAYWVNAGYPNESSNLAPRSLMRDAPFGLQPCFDFTMDSSLYAGHPAVPQFDDGQGHYPGAEYVSRGPGYSPPSVAWVTRQWDASVVQAARSAYGLKAVGYTGSEDFRYNASRSGAGLLTTYRLLGLGNAGGTGNPGDSGAHYGWNARVLSQSPTEATVAVWNALEFGPLSASADSYAVTSYNVPLYVAAPGVMANDTGPPDWAVVSSAELVAAPSHGSVTLHADGGFTYTPTPGSAGSDRFTYRLRTSPFAPASSPIAVIIRWPGDANRDGAANVLDLRSVLSVAAGLSRADAVSFDFANADIDLDGRVDIRDATRIARLVSGLG